MKIKKMMLNDIRVINCFLIKKRKEETRTVHSPLLNFPKNPIKNSVFYKDLDTTLIKSELKALILRFARTECCNDQLCMY